MELKREKTDIKDIPIWIQIRRGKFIVSVWDQKYLSLLKIQDAARYFEPPEKADGVCTFFYPNLNENENLDIDQPSRNSSIGLGIKPPSTLYKKPERNSECYYENIEDDFLVNELIEIISDRRYVPIYIRPIE